MKIINKHLWVLCFLLMGSLGHGNNLYAQSSEVKQLLRQGMKECREAKSLRRSDLNAAINKYNSYLDFLSKAIALEGNVTESDDSTVRRVLDFCNSVKADLDRSRAVPMLEQGISECGDAKVLLSNGAFGEARAKHKIYLEYKNRALALSESVLDVYQRSYVLRTCDQLVTEIQAAEKDYKEQLLAEKSTKNQVEVNNVISLLNDSLSECRGAQSVINDKTRYGGQTLEQVETLSKSSSNSKQKGLKAKSALIASGTKINSRNTGRINKVVSDITECQSTIPQGIVAINSFMIAQSRSKLNPSAAKQSSAKNSKAQAAGKNSKYKQIVGKAAKYPRRALNKDLEGSVIVRFTITKLGDVTDVEVASSTSPIFNKSAIVAVKKYKYQPRIENGKAVDTKGVEKKLNYKLQ